MRPTRFGQIGGVRPAAQHDHCIGTEYCRSHKVDPSSRTAFTDKIGELPAGARVTGRSLRHIAGRVADGLAVSGTGGALLSWPISHAAFVVHADALLAEPAAVVVLGIDETRRGRPVWSQHEDTRRWTVSERFETNFVDLAGEQGLLGQTAGRTKLAVTAWLDVRGQALGQRGDLDTEPGPRQVGEDGRVSDPAISASSIARPAGPLMSVATDVNSTPASSSRCQPLPVRSAPSGRVIGQGPRPAQCPAAHARSARAVRRGGHTPARAASGGDDHAGERPAAAPGQRSRRSRSARSGRPVPRPALEATASQHSRPTGDRRQSARGAPRNGQTGTDLPRPGGARTVDGIRARAMRARRSGTRRAYLMFEGYIAAPNTARDRQQYRSGRRESNSRSQLGNLVGDRPWTCAEVRRCAGQAQFRAPRSFVDVRREAT